MITYKEYMANSNFDTHHQFYSQFVTEGVKNRVALAVDIELLAKDFAEGDKHLNKSYSCSKVWERIMPCTPYNVYTMLREAGDCNSISTQVCIVKAAAHILIDEYNKGNTHD